MADFGSILKQWRSIRRFSQLQLAMEAQLSARHLSFLESGRANPSKAMVLRLSHVLDMPRPVVNQALFAVGLAPVYPDGPADAAALAPVRKAVERMLAAHDPFPGVVVDRHWTILSSNRGGEMLKTLAPSHSTHNLIDILIATAQSGLIENWEEVAALSLMRLRSEIAECGGDETLAALAQRIVDQGRLSTNGLSAINLDQAIIPTILRIGDVRLSLFSTIAQFGSVQDVRSGELKIELMFPADEATEAWFVGINRDSM
jgi:transcriptional regulator with XRE-family HTH domain